MAAERCPLCQSKLKNGECLSCGYRPPDESDISALYNYDPTDYPQPQQAIREIIPDVQMEEIYPNRPAMPDIKVHDDQNNTIGGYGGQGVYVNKTPQNNNPNPYAENGTFKPYQSPTQQQQQQQPTGQQSSNPNPYAGGNFQPYQKPSPFSHSTSSGNTFGEFLKGYWIFLLLSFLFNPLGIIFFAIFRNKVESKYRWLFIAVMFLRVLFPL